MNNDSNSHWIREEILPSQLPLKIFENVCVRILREQNGEVNRNRYRSLSQIAKLPSIKDEETNFYDEACAVSDDLIESFEYITVIVYGDGISINGRRIMPLGGPIVCASLLHLNSSSQEDSLLISIADKFTVLLRFDKTDIDFDVVVLEKIDQIFNKMVTNERATKLFASDFFKVTSIFEIHYSSFGSPLLELEQNIVTSANIIDSCVLQLTDVDDLLVNLNLSFEKITKIECYSNFDNAKDSNINHREHLMKNTFEMPLFTIALRNTKTILFLQNTGYTLKGSCFLYTGSGDDQEYFQYPELFELDSYYVPKSPLNLFSSQNSNSALYGHDQVLLASSLHPAIFSLDIFFNHTKGGFQVNMRRLFSFSIPISIFTLTQFGDDFLKFTVCSLSGITESRIIELLPKTDISNTSDTSYFSLKYVEKLFSLVNTVPVFDFCLVNNPFANVSKEFCQEELWVSARPGSKSALMNIRKGHISTKYKIANEVSKTESETIQSFTLKNTKYLVISNSDESYLAELEDAIFNDIELEDSQKRNNDKIYFTVIEKTRCNESILSSGFTPSFDYFIKVHPTYISICSLLDFKEVGKVGFDGKAYLGHYCNGAVIVATESSIKYFKYSEGTFNEDTSIDFSNTSARSLTMLYMETFGIDKNCFLFVGSIGKLEIYQITTFSSFRLITTNLGALRLSNQLLCLCEQRGLFMLTSYDGYYALLQISFSDASVTILNTIKLSDTVPVNISGYDSARSVIFLNSGQCWRINFNRSIYPKCIVIDEMKNRHLNTACLINSNKDHHDILLNRTDGFSFIKVPVTEGSLIKKFNMPATILKMFHAKYISTFIMIPIIDRREENYDKEEKLIFFDTKYKRLLKWVNKGEFEKSEYIQCISDWQLETESGYNIYRTLIGCRMELGNGRMRGTMKICNIKLEENDVNIEVLYNWEETSPITCVSWCDKNKIIYSSGTRVIERAYSPQKKGLLNEEIKFEMGSTIKRFEISNNKILIITVNDSFTVCNLPDYTIIRQGDGIQYLGDAYLKSGEEDKYEIILGDAQNCSVNIYSEPATTQVIQNTIIFNDNLLKFKTGSFPRIKRTFSFSPWVNYEERVDICSHAAFIAVGMGGQIDFFSAISSEQFRLIKLLQADALNRGPLEYVLLGNSKDTETIIDITHLKTKGVSYGAEISLHNINADKIFNRYII